ncbi:MAG: TerB family tellurite resistance protein [Candidatus Competibacteraceae bacterium]
MRRIHQPPAWWMRCAYPPYIQAIPNEPKYLQNFGYETTAAQAAEILRALPYERKVALIRHMEEIAKADNQLDEKEAGLIRRTIALLNEEPAAR